MTRIFIVLLMAVLLTAASPTANITVTVSQSGGGGTPTWIIGNSQVGIKNNQPVKTSYATQATVGANTITLVDWFGPITVGWAITGTGIPAGTTITGVNNFVVTISNGITTAMSSTPVTATGPFTVASAFNPMSYNANSALVFVTSCTVSGCATSTATPPAPTNVFLSMTPSDDVGYPGGTQPGQTATCSAVPGATVGPGVTGLNVWTYLCTNLSLTQSTWFNAQFSGIAISAGVQYFELYGCANACVAEVANTFTGAATNGVMSIATSAATTSATDMIVSFAETQNAAALNGGSCCTVVFNNNHYSMAEYQVAGNPGVYSNNMSVTTRNNVSMAIVALKQASAPAVSAPNSISPVAYTVLDNAPVGTLVNNGGGTTGNGVYIDTVGGQLFAGTTSMPTSPGGYLTYNPASRTLTTNQSPMTDGTYTGTLSAVENAATLNSTITLSVLPSSYPPQTGNCDAQPPPQALRAGFTTLATCLDFSASKYAGLPSTWLSCSYPKTGTETSYDLSENYGNFCNDNTYWHQGVDPTTGKTVMIFSWNGANCGQQGYPTYGSCRNFLQSVVSGPVPAGSIDNGAGWDVPAGHYVEIRMRQDPIITPGGQCCSPDFFLWGVNCFNSNAVGYPCTAKPPYAGVNEQDIVEMYQRSASAADHTNWMYLAPSNDYANSVYPATNALYNTSDITPFIPGFSIVAQHTYGWMTTVNGKLTGSSVFQACGYIDDILIVSTSGGENCFRRGSAIQPQAGRNLQNRMQMNFWLGDSNQSYTVYIERIAVWECANWKNNQPDQTNDMCLANGLSQ